MNVLLTGATGYLGSHLAERLITDGHSVACIVRDEARLGRLDRLKDSVLIIPAHDMEGRCRNRGFDAVVHTACTYARNGKTMEEVLEGNLYFPLKVLQLAKSLGVKRWMNTGTCLPIMTNSYTLAKGQFEQWGRLFAEERQLQFVNLELEHIYGPDAPESYFLSWVIDKLKKDDPLDLTEGTQHRDFIHIEDVVEIFVKILGADLKGCFVNIPVGTGTAPAIREVVAYLKEAAGSRSELRFGAVPMRKREHDSCCDTSMIEAVGAMPKISWREGMKNILR